MNKTTNLTKERIENKQEKIQEAETRNRIMYYMDLFEIVIIVAVIGLVFWAIRKLIIGGRSESLDIIIDFVVAGMSILFLSFSIVFSKVGERARYIYAGVVLLLITFIGFVILFIIAVKIKNSNIARIMSITCLGLSMLLEVIKHIIFTVQFAKKRRLEREMNIDALEKRSSFDGSFNNP